jgi:hypothetical protein
MYFLCLRMDKLMPVIRLFSGLSLLFITVASLQAQGEPRSIAGRVLLPGIGAEGTPVAGAWVTLHRVGPDAAGPIDSLRTSRDGRYEFRYRATGDRRILAALEAYNRDDVESTWLLYRLLLGLKENP